MKNNRTKGFTLLEIMAVIGIIGLLATFAYPSYVKYIAQARRVDGQTALLDLAQRMERYHLANHTYSTATIAISKNSDVLADASTPQQWYTLKIIEQTTNNYVLHAVPNGNQALRDETCSTLTLNQAGVKGITGSGNVEKCW